MHLAKVELTENQLNPGALEIILQGSLDINSANYIHSQFSRSLKRYNEIRLSIKNPDKIDISFVQLFYAFHKTAAKKGVQLIHKIELTDEVALLLERSGINLQTIVNQFNNNEL